MGRKGLFSFIVLLALSLVLVACGGGGTTGSDEGEKNYISILTGGNQGTYYPLGGTFAKVINDNVENVEATATSTGASVENVQKLSDGEGEIAFVQTDIAAYATEGTIMFEEDGAVETIQAMGSLYPETIQIVTTKDSGIESVEDLKGKTVSIGAPGSGTRANAENILEVHDMTVDDMNAQNLDFGESTSGIQDGKIDAAFITSGTPTGAVEGLAATTDVIIVPVEADKADALIEKYPYYATDTIKEGTYGLESDVPTVAVQAMLITSSDVSEDRVYEMTKAIFDHTDAISHTKGEFISAESALEGVGIELHPGAKKYFDEKGMSK
ncbi:TAXI family TRAP transporter solute-binding subunit [Pontibacillus litoralis]|uniref:Immunogenic protein n=1 Tax=Pontibacillus litoralis JSM 072002 TaxID=1385512 RepID=A0A0A5G3J5_9BACI|nr:TAXI family TRAP transporter solute-binding subunit [Pontibacillus litoralis]KGX87691.1 immunogenic protein [Pontibacillus litoralis JSM 072002]